MNYKCFPKTYLNNSHLWLAKKKLSDVRREPYSAYFIKMSFLKLNLFFLCLVRNF